MRRSRPRRDRIAIQARSQAPILALTAVTLTRIRMTSPLSECRQIFNRYTLNLLRILLTLRFSVVTSSSRMGAATPTPMTTNALSRAPGISGWGSLRPAVTRSG